MPEKIVIGLISFLGGIIPTLLVLIFKKSVFITKLPLEVMQGVTAAEESLRDDLMKQIVDLKAEVKELKAENKQLREENKSLERRISRLERDKD